jgi:hypothetical protein
MSKIPFTDEQIKLLRENPYTYNVTPNTLYLTKAFKELFYKEYQDGKLPRQILEDHGYPQSVLGANRIWGIASVIKKEAQRPGGFSEGTVPNKIMTLTETSQEDSIKQLQHEVEYLRQEVEFLKKISSIRNTRK